MLTLKEFEILTTRPESTTLDFKATQFDFSADADGKKIASFVKDIISFSNTVRSEPAYVILGIKENEDHSKTFHGITTLIDDATFQGKVKDRVHPRPVFHAYTIRHRGLVFGILEFPITKYATPLMPTVRMRGLEPGEVYHRHGTANTKALAMEVIRIHAWLQALPDRKITTQSLQEEAGLILKTLTNMTVPLSSVMTDVYRLAKQHGQEELLTFSSAELAGLASGADENKELNYRIRKIFLSSLRVELNPYNIQPCSVVKNELGKTKGFSEFRLLFSQSIAQLENLHDGMKEKPNHTIAVITLSAKNIFDNLKGADYAVYAYVFPDDLKGLFTAIRQQAIDLLMKI